ncbi:protein arginine N-methyltransferase 7-like isoform X1 [Rhopilema esculentum]|uniref:protein arginine N-methyltransferase 7-like isoform X1 n=1 Tax=Rhopilema esculentum TaxID=499914 RepID=UPI0031DD2997
MFVLKDNPVTGTAEWLFKETEDDDAKHELARSTYAGMLHDVERNKKYHEAIKKTIHKIKEAGHASHVLDIGTGSGILAMMAASCGAQSVTACEVFRPMAKIANNVVERNELQSKIKIVDKRSTEMLVGKEKDLMERANILVTEIFDSELIGEGVLPTLKHAKEHLLTEDCKVVPATAKVFIQAAESQNLWKRHKLGNVEFSDLKSLKTMAALNECQGTAATDELHVDQVDDLRVMSNCIEAVRFDFNAKPNAFATQLEQTIYQLEIEATESGCVHCIILWWDLSLDEDEEFTLSMAPKCSSLCPDKVIWRDHWMQAIYYLREELYVVKGQKFALTLHRDDYCFWFDMTRENPCEGSLLSKKLSAGVDRPVCTCGLHTVWSRERFSMSNNRDFWNVYSNALSKQKQLTNVLVLGDVSLLPLFAAKFANQVTYIEFSQMSGNLIAKLSTLNGLQDKIKISNKRNLNDDDFTNLSKSTEFDAVLVEPFFSTSLFPWEHLTFWYYLTKIFQNTLGRQPTVIPQKGILKLAAVEFKDLWKVRKPVGSIEGFKLDAFDRIIKDALQPDHSDEFGALYEAEPYAIWEYDHAVLSEIHDAGTFDFSNPIPRRNLEFNGKTKIVRNGVLHALVAWVDFWLDEDLHWSTGYEVQKGRWVKYSKQGVVLLKDPITVTNKQEIEYRVVFEAESCNLLFQYQNERV